MRLFFIIIATLLLFCNVQLAAQKAEAYKAQWQFPPKDKSMVITAEQQREIAATEEEMKWFKDAKFGIFVHWGPALQVTDVLSWGRLGERPAANKPATNGIPAKVYDRQYLSFNPVDFDADEWMEQVKSFGAHYLVFTAKHHDGFCMFDAPNTDYDIEHTPFKRDICKELAEAARRHGVKIFWYYSQPDWTHPDCLRENHYESYLPYMKEQVEHLYTNYGRIDGVFWDHLTSKYWQWDSYHLLKDMRKWQPGLLSNPRSGFGWPDNDRRGDYDTPEQSLGPVDHPRYWEACLTMTDKWLYHKNGPIKKAENVLGMLIQVVGNGGNLLLNLGPNGEGTFVKEEAAEAARVGGWLQQYGNTLYNTRRGIYVGGDWGASTQRGDTLYLHVLEKLANDAAATISLPLLPVGIKLAEGVTLGFKGYRIENDRLLLDFDRAAFGMNLDNIVQLVLEEAPVSFERIPTWAGEPLANDKFKVSASSFNNQKHHPEAIYNTKGNVFSEGIHLKGWWEPEKEDEQPELTLHFPARTRVQTVLMSENMRSHSVRDYALLVQREAGGDWHEVYRGDVIGEGMRVKLSGEAIHGVKLRISQSAYATRISAFNAYE
ncbi:alpha-L-fucosidase [Neolewinella persica]|uniref:alpha-L-fucosidase n=1 Tax=Neolewinella persica TaxID=70998 RepID=UPI0003744063|nr:alpha-L-fucosidase [Neolewinella persica]